MKFMKLTKWQFAIASICMITGLMLTVTLQAQENSRINPTSERSEKYASIAEKLQQEVAALEMELVDLRNELTKNQEAVVGDTNDELTKLQNELQNAKIKAGLTPVTGSGLKFTIDDRKEALKLDLANQKNDDFVSDLASYLVHDYFLRNIVYDLRNAGAEAIALNGQRVISSSEIICGGAIIWVNGQQISAPFTIEAIGNFDKLKEGLENGDTANPDFGFINYPNKYPAKIEQISKLVLPAYTSNYNLKFVTLDDNATEGGN